MKTKFHYSAGIVMLSLILPAAADIIYSGLLNPATSAIPTNFTGITVTVGDGTLNPFFGGVGVANNNFLQPGRIGTGNLDAIVNFGAGATINSGMTLDAALGYGGSSTHVGAGALQFAPGSEGYIGFKLDAVNYGWMRVVFTNNTGGAVVKDWAYDNSGAALVTGNVLQSAVSGAAQTVTLTSASGSFTLGSAITDALGNTGGVVNSVVKQGAGTTVLSAANSYTGTTTVSAGSLAINGDQSAATGAVTVAAGVTDATAVRLEGIGTVGGNTTFAADPDGAFVPEGAPNEQVGGIHSPGNSVGKQTFDAPGAAVTNVTYSDGSIFEWELASTVKETPAGVDGGGVRGTDYDAVNVSGTLAGLDGGDVNSTTDAIFRVVLTGTQNFSEAFWDADRTWTDIFKTADAGSNIDYASIFGGGFQYFNSTGAIANANTTSRSFTISGSSLTWSAVPEPSSALVGLLIGAGLLRRRRSA